MNRAPFLLTQALRRRGFGRLLYVASTAAQVGGIITGQTVQVNGGVYFT